MTDNEIKAQIATGTFSLEQLTDDIIGQIQSADLLVALTNIIAEHIKNFTPPGDPILEHLFNKLRAIQNHAAIPPEIFEDVENFLNGKISNIGKHSEDKYTLIYTHQLIKLIRL